MRRFELSDGVSSKFWEVEQAGSELHIGFGKIGTAGQRQCKSFPDQARASAALDKLIREKTAKGYAETGAAAAVVAAPAAAKPAAPAAATPLALPGDTPPWLAADALVQLSPELAAHVLPSRRHPGPPPSTNADLRWALYLKRVREHCPLRARAGGAPDGPGVIEAIARISRRERHGSPESDAVLLATETVNEEYEPASDGCPFLDVLVADKGLLYAFDVVMMLQRIWIHPDYDNDDSVYTADHVSWGVHRLYGVTTLALRAHLAHAPQALWEQCVQRARAAAGTLHTRARPLLAALLPDAPELANELALMLQPETDDKGLPKWNSNYAWLIVYATSPEAKQALRLWPSGEGLWRDTFHSSLRGLATALQDRGAAAIDAIMGGSWADQTAQALGCIGTPEAIAALAQRHYYEWQFGYLVEAVERWPDAAMAGLSQVIASREQGPDRARQLLAAAVARHAHRVPALAPWMTAPAWKVLSVAAAQYITVRDCAAASDLPPVLAAPPWRAPATREAAAFALAPLALAPVADWSEAEREHLAGKRSFYDGTGHIKSRRAEAKAAVAAVDLDGSLAGWIDCLAPGQAIEDATSAIVALPEPINARVWNAVVTLGMNHPGAALARIGLPALPGLIATFTRAPSQELEYVTCFGAVELAAPMAHVYATLKTSALLAMARAWFLRFPEHAACALIAPALGKVCAGRDHARRVLGLLERAGHRDLLIEVAGRYGRDDVGAAMRALLDQGPLQNYPAKIGKLPGFCTPLVWSRPVLAANGKALPDAAMDAIAIMLRFPHADGVYAGIDQIKQACTPESLSDFAWDLYFAWVDDGAKAKENWAFYALGLLGNDDTARRLTSLLRVWPGHGLHARAVTGLDVLALIGSDTALMLLNGIALKLKFKPLQDRAQEKIKAIAEARGLTSDELEDRLAPDLGLDEQGTLLLDFGPRQFRVGFDETLKPFVRDADGTRSADLPKPKRTDHAELAADAVKRFKLLKKDARTIAAQQVLRLELAMCAQRRWPVQVFNDCMVTHPLVRHLAQRLVWGVYDAHGRLQACFRVTPEGAFSDAADDAVALPQGEGAVIGIPHALDMAPADATAFGQLFADYELLQPFVQIGRDTHTLDEGEETYHALGRWDGEVVPTGRLLGLLNQGWRLGETHDSAMIRDLLKVLGDGYTATLDMAPGIRAGSAHEFAEQTLGSVCIGRGGPKDIRESVPLSSLGAATVSELIGDMNKLCA
ncbi:DUF4132 domain-containing protein [Massilia mucilaginosa]|nr:WGR and DUF4132 domain-containing protein [Massilia mucilaginosa]